MLNGLETVVYFTRNLKAAATWYSETFSIKPNYDTDHYVGFTVAGDELGLHPIEEGAAPAGQGQTAYWSVANVHEVIAHLLGAGAKPHKDVAEVGGGIRIGEVVDPFGNILGVIENPKSPNKS